jgi:hypothetical protein
MPEIKDLECLVTFEALPADACHWPEGDELPHLFCGRPRVEGSSYCDAHRVRGLAAPQNLDKTLAFLHPNSGPLSLNARPPIE